MFGVGLNENSIINPTVKFAVHEQLLSKFNINDDVENDNTDED